MTSPLCRAEWFRLVTCLLGLPTELESFPASSSGVESNSGIEYIIRGCGKLGLGSGTVLLDWRVQEEIAMMRNM